jgi:membrane protease subunit HflK
VVIDDPSKGGASVAPFLPLPAFAPFQGGQK